MSAVCIGYFDSRITATGLWCDQCALPSRAEFELLLVTDYGVTPQGMRSICVEHESL